MTSLRAVRSVVLIIVLVLIMGFVRGEWVSPSVQWKGNGHYYQVVHIDGGISWDDAKAAAEAEGGYLATLTSAAENEWLTTTFGGGTPEGFPAYLDGCWIGGYQPPGSAEPDGGWTWVTGEAWNFTNWWPPIEPNNNPDGENAVVLEHGLLPGTGAAWNDLNSSWVRRGYVLEYSADSDGDGVPDDQDACPDEDATGFDADGDGCIDNMPGLIGTVKRLVDEGVINKQLYKSIVSHVTNAAKSAKKENINAVIGQLTALIHEIDAQTTKKISEESAEQVVEYIENIIRWYRSQMP